MIEDFIDALRNFSRSKTRTFLSLLGVIIGVASVIRTRSALPALIWCPSRLE